MGIDNLAMNVGIFHVRRVISDCPTNSVRISQLDETTASTPSYFKHIMRGNPFALKSWAFQTFSPFRKRSSSEGKHIARHIHLAALALLFALVLT